MTVALILPMHNEEESIPALTQSLSESKWEGVDITIPVNDGSRDGTLGLLRRWEEDEPRLKVVSYSPNRGLPGACTAGFVAAIEMGLGDNPDDVLVTMDADASHPVSLIPSMVQEILKGKDIVIASRHQKGASQKGLTLARKVLSWGASGLMRSLYPVYGLRDYSTNFRAYRASLIKKALEISGGKLVESTGFVGVVELLLRLVSMEPDIGEVPLNLRYDLKESESKMQVGRTIQGYLSLALRPKVQTCRGKGLALLKP